MAHCEASLGQVPGEAYRQRVFLQSLKMNKEVNLTPREACQPRAQTLLVIVAQTLLSYKLESEEYIPVHYPQRVRQFSYLSVLVAEVMFVGPRILQILTRAKRLLCRGLWHEAVMSPEEFCFGKSMWRSWTDSWRTKRSPHRR